MDENLFQARKALNCFNCGGQICPGESYLYNRSRKAVCLDCEDSDDAASLRSYEAWASFNGVK